VAIRCPGCATLAPVAESEVGASGRIARCRRCGTTWIAHRSGVTGKGPIRLDPPADVSDAIVIEHIGPGFHSPTGLPPRRTRRPPDRRLRWLAFSFFAAVGLWLISIPIVGALPRIGGGDPAAGGLELRAVRTRTVHVRGVDTLFVEGEVVNRSGRDMMLPAIRIGLSKRVERRSTPGWSNRLTPGLPPVARSVFVARSPSRRPGRAR
jgi:predicted Zn finger-like uncharacterized protein